VSHFGEALHPDDVPPWHQGDDLIVDEPDEIADTALPTWLDARQPVLEPIEALIPAQGDDDAEYL
jgi:hypothetical protein